MKETREATKEEAEMNEARLKALEAAPDKVSLGWRDNDKGQVGSWGTFREVAYTTAAKHIAFFNRQMTEGVRWAYRVDSNALCATMSPQQAAAFERHISRRLMPLDEDKCILLKGECEGCS